MAIPDKADIDFFDKLAKEKYQEAIDKGYFVSGGPLDMFKNKPLLDPNKLYTDEAGKVHYGEQQNFTLNLADPQKQDYLDQNPQQIASMQDTFANVQPAEQQQAGGMDGMQKAALAAQVTGGIYNALARMATRAPSSSGSHPMSFQPGRSMSELFRR